MKYQRKKINAENFILKKQIGKGSLSKVFLVLFRETKRYHIAKIVSKNEVLKKNQQKKIFQEIKILSNLDHSFFPKFRGTFQNSSDFYIFMDFIPGGDFYYFQKNMNCLSLKSGIFYIAHLILILEKLHEQKIVYRDLKPENILIEADGYLKIIDFKSSVIHSKKYSRSHTLSGIMEFQSPEMILRVGHSFPTDLWSLGIFIFEMFAQKGPFYLTDPMKLYMKTLNVKYNFPNNFPDSVKSLVSGLLQKKEKKRLGNLNNGFKDLKDYFLFKNFSWDMLEKRKLVPPYIPKVKNDRDIKNFPLLDSQNLKLINIDLIDDPFIYW